MRKLETTYRSYLLRLWHKDEPKAAWQAMLESITQDGSRQYFNDLESLAAFIQNLAQESEEAEES